MSMSYHEIVAFTCGLFVVWAMFQALDWGR